MVISLQPSDLQYFEKELLSELVKVGLEAELMLCCLCSLHHCDVHIVQWFEEASLPGSMKVLLKSELMVGCLFSLQPSGAHNFQCFVRQSGIGLDSKITLSQLGHNKYLCETSYTV